MLKNKRSKLSTDFESDRYSFPGPQAFLAFHKKIVDRVIWPYSTMHESLYRWRAHLLSTILIAALFFGSIALASATILIIKENVWGLAVVDFSGLVLCLLFLFKNGIRFEVRAFITILAFFLIGVGVILSVGPLSGGPAWLFAFSVLAGVLMGNRAAITAILMNSFFLIILGVLLWSKKYGSEFPQFESDIAMITAGINFIGLNAITAISVSALLNLLHSSEKRYRLIAQNVADVIWTMDMDFKFTYVSPSVEQLLGYSVDEALGKELDEIISADSLEKILAIYEKRMAMIENKDEKAWESTIFEAVHICKDGKTTLANIHARFLKGKDNNPIGILGITRDISARKKMEHEKIKAQIAVDEQNKLALVGQIAGKMAHDFNNVLGIIMGQSELALMDCKDKEHKHIFEQIFNQTLRGKNLTKNLVAFAKSPEPKQDFFFINQKIEFVLNLFENDLEDIHLIKSYTDDVEVLADPGMIEHAIVNLIQNSIHAISLVDDPTITLKTYCSTQYIHFEILDNGCGIPDDHLLRIFEPSFTLKGSQDILSAYSTSIKGSGYGLANVKKYIELHKGTVHVTSQLGAGTAFCVRLPIINKKLSNKEKEKILQKKGFSHKKILLVEDEKPISEVQKRILTQAPCEHDVDVAANGRDTIGFFEKNKYDLISLDYVLPGKMNGMDIYTYIRQKNKTIPILFISGNIQFLESIKKLMEKDPFIDHVSKPCQHVDYIHHINKLLSAVESYGRKN